MNEFTRLPLRAQPWAQSRAGRAVDLANPVAAQVDFRELADVLAQGVRYAGNSLLPVSIGQHSLITLTIARQRKASPTLQAHVVLHDAHEWILGDWTTPAQQAVCRVALEMFGPTAETYLTDALAETKRRHDAAIFAAAGLAEPTPEQRAFIRACDLSALMTEKRDFLAPGARAWAIRAAEFPPLARRQKWMPPADVAAELWRAFRTLLPVFRDGLRSSK
jgi:hypothetical protein